MMLAEVIAVYSESFAKHTDKLRGQNAEWLYSRTSDNGHSN